MKMFLGRYTGIIATILMFLTLVLCVLGLNFYSSFETEQTAEAVNIAGRQRMLSQRTAKSLISLQSKYRAGLPYQKDVSELKEASNLFDRSLNAFIKGSATESTKVGEALLTVTSDPEGRAILEEAGKLWRPFYSSLENMFALMEQSSAEASVVTALMSENVSYADAHINSLLRLMNDLTNYQEDIAIKAADQSRLTQALGILASLVCFAIILYLIFGQLQRSDRRAAQARRETRQIFSTVDQGLFLIRQDFLIGSQQSQELERIFLRAPQAGQNFNDFIEPLVSQANLNKVQRFLNLLFDPHKKQALLTDLNPLNEVPIQIEQSGVLIDKYLRFSFSRVVDEGQIKGVLTSVTDISNEIRLARELENQTKRNEQQLQMVSVLLKTNSDSLPEFLLSSDETYQKINGVLRSSGTSIQEFAMKAKSIMALIHSVKGNSAMLGLDLITQACHEFENHLDVLNGQAVVSGNDFLVLTVQLDRLISLNEQMRSVLGSVLIPVSDDQCAQTNNDSLVRLTEFTQEVAARQNRTVSLNVAGLDDSRIDKTLRASISSLASQLVRNAICHGIESPEVRKSSGKKGVGKVSVALFRNATGDLYLTCEDDGGGVDFSLLASKAKEMGLLSARNSEPVNPKKLLSLMLSNRLSTREHVDFDAGRGVGLNVIGEQAKKLNAKVYLKTEAGLGTRFMINIPKPRDNISTEIPSAIKSMQVNGVHAGEQYA